MSTGNAKGSLEMKISNDVIGRYCNRYLLLVSAFVLSGLCSARAEAPDFLADAIENVGGGYFDTGYKFKMSDYPKTASVSVDITMTGDTIINGGEAAVFGGGMGGGGNPGREYPSERRRQVQGKEKTERML